MKLRTIERQCLWNSSMNLENIIGALEAEGIPAKKVVRALSRFCRIGIPVEKVANALVITFKLGMK